MIDWDVALRAGNGVFDRAVAVLRNPNRATRERQLDQLEEDLKTMRSSMPKSNLTDLVRRMKQLGRAGSQWASDVLVLLLFPDVRKVQAAADRAEQAQRNLHLAFALAAYRSEHGRYPAGLDVLAPLYLKQAPGDLFSGEPLRYHLSEDGYLLFSMGSGKDDLKGKAGEEPPGDGLRIRMPLPELKKQ